MSFDGISRMALEGHDSLQDVERLKRKNKWSRSEWLECKRHAEDKDTERDYRKMLLMFYSCLDMPEYHKTKRGKVICIDDEDDCDEEYDHAYKLFLSSLMEQGETRPLKVENGFSGYGFGMQTQLDNNACARASMGPDKEQNVRGRKRVLSTRQYNLRTQVSKSIRKTVGKRDEPLSQKTPSINCLTENEWATENLCEHADPPQLVEEVARGAKGDHVVSKRALVHFENEHSRSRQGPGNNRLAKRQSEHVDENQIGEKSKVHKLRKKFYAYEGTNLVKEENEPEIMEIDKVQSRIYLQQLEKEKNVIRVGGGACRERVVRIETHEETGRKRRLTKYQNEHVDQAGSVKKYKKQMDRNSKGKNIFNVDHETSKKATVKIDKENFYQVLGGKNNYVTRDDCGQKYALKDEPDDGVETRFGRKIINELRSGRTAKCLVKYKNGDETYLIKKEDDDIVSEVKILDNALIETEILSPFVPSRRYDSTWMHADIKNPSCPAASEDEFRKEVLKVLRQPYDKEESKRYRAAIKAGSYLDHHRDLGKRLSKYRYKRGKCLALLRGFFFWLQNLTREGSFQPWRDRQCLAVESPSC